jgi:hypothetical protein
VPALFRGRSWAVGLTFLDAVTFALGNRIQGHCHIRQV